MKKLLLLFSLCGLVLSISCVKKGDGGIFCSWWVRNTTDQTLIFKCPSSESLPRNSLEYRELELKPNSNLKIFSGRRVLVDGPSFEYYFEVSVEKLGEDVSWQLLSEDGVVLRTWNYSDRDLSGQRFFEESSWTYLYNWEWWVNERWSFVIQPEDIAKE